MNLHLDITQDLGHGIMVIFLCCALTALAKKTEELLVNVKKLLNIKIDRTK